MVPFTTVFEMQPPFNYRTRSSFTKSIRLYGTSFFSKVQKTRRTRVIPGKNDVHLLNFNAIWICTSEIMNKDGERNVSPGRETRGANEIFDWKVPNCKRIGVEPTKRRQTSRRPYADNGVLICSKTFGRRGNKTVDTTSVLLGMSVTFVRDTRLGV